ncbi:MAG: hypothetical protein PHG23_01795, partial [Candidatus Pacebacteria bacterium]|nr:hypothetical protein [Candidatus Paceibacterota bacterium]
MQLDVQITKEALIELVKQRKTIIIGIISSLEKPIVNWGKRINPQARIGAVYELQDIGGYSFRASYGETMMGGNTITIWQASVVDAPCNKPLVIKWQGVTDECVVSGDDSFLPELLKLIGQMPHILAAKEQAERQRKEDFKRR